MAPICRDDLPDGHSEKFLEAGLDRQLAVEIPEEISRTAPRAWCPILLANQPQRLGSPRPAPCGAAYDLPECSARIRPRAPLTQRRFRPNACRNPAWNVH